MKLKKLFVILYCLSAAACASDAPAPQAVQAPSGAEPSGVERSTGAAGQQTQPPSDASENVVVPDNAQVTITKKRDLTIEEYRVGGRLYMIKITPKHGKPYYLVDDVGDGRFARRGSGHFMVSPPMWVIKKF